MFRAGKRRGLCNRKRNVSDKEGLRRIGLGVVGLVALALPPRSRSLRFLCFSYVFLLLVVVVGVGGSVSMLGRFRYVSHRPPMSNRERLGKTKQMGFGA
ncbi:hypothetical protein MRB53_020197 [Persea americana]|uniref:Uncharacterized protein n=1 Tax=Persea americana TaxID=3435 RepID=A0ACC2L0P5_PERAE|nr:hypothetical protein MRB53_020197 [Persea americana]